jgi:hypothetical protein
MFEYKAREYDPAFIRDLKRAIITGPRPVTMTNVEVVELCEELVVLFTQQQSTDWTRNMTDPDPDVVHVIRQRFDELYAEWYVKAPLSTGVPMTRKPMRAKLAGSPGVNLDNYAAMLVQMNLMARVREHEAGRQQHQMEAWRTLALFFMSCLSDGPTASWRDMEMAPLEIVDMEPPVVTPQRATSHS